MEFPGHMQQGGSPSPFDRNMGTKQATKAATWMIEILKSCSVDGKVFTNSNDTVCMLGMVGRQYKFTPLSDLIKETNFE